jgi:hypothetical protein
VDKLEVSCVFLVIGASDDEIAILLGMLTVDPNTRLTMDGIMNHPWSMT